jgi:hypothetical protein
MAAIARLTISTFPATSSAQYLALLDGLLLPGLGFDGERFALQMPRVLSAPRWEGAASFELV